MLQAMMQAEVGDDVFGEDPTVSALEQKVADIFGMEEGLFFPSGTMANQSGIKALTSPGDEIICDQFAHIYLYEGGGLASNSGLSTSLLPGNRGRLTADQVNDAIRGDNIHYPKTSVVSIENTHNRGGGSVYSLESIKAIRKLCDEHGLKLHMDGARIFNALEAADYNAKDIGKQVHTISVSLSKAMGAPIGSVLTGNRAVISKARRIRKVMGGGMRQAGFIAAAGIYAIDNHLPLLREDHRRAAVLGESLRKLPFVEEVVPVDTNIVITRLNNKLSEQAFIEILLKSNIKTVAFGKQAVRMVTHLDFNDDQLDYVCEVLNKLK